MLSVIQTICFGGKGDGFGMVGWGGGEASRLTQGWGWPPQRWPARATLQFPARPGQAAMAHEIGHVLGLGHPDQAVDAVQNLEHTQLRLGTPPDTANHE